MSESLLDRLKRKIAEAGTDAWESAQAQELTLDDDTRIDPATGILQGGLSFRVKDSAGAWHLVYHERMNDVRAVGDLDNFLAHAFSIFLMKHPTWPK